MCVRLATIKPSKNEYRPAESREEKFREEKFLPRLCIEKVGCRDDHFINYNFVMQQFTYKPLQKIKW